MKISTEVEIRVSVDGTVTPLRFTWHGSTLRVAQISRTWSDDEGTHWLVMAAFPERVFELLRTGEGAWQVVGSSPRPFVI